MRTERDKPRRAGVRVEQGAKHDAGDQSDQQLVMKLHDGRPSVRGDDTCFASGQSAIAAGVIRRTMRRRAIALGSARSSAAVQRKPYSVRMRSGNRPTVASRLIHAAGATNGANGGAST